jgi:diphosphomevalonate decarboxylase
MGERMIFAGRADAAAHPSLAMIKYWGKQDKIRNLPATPSLAVTLDGLTTETSVEIFKIDDNSEGRDQVYLEGIIQDEDRFSAFFTEFRKLAGQRRPGFGPFILTIRSTSNFPAAAGLASSASGFAALSWACNDAAGLNLTIDEISGLARIGSASAARSVLGGFTRLDAGSESAEAVHDENWWPALRIIVLELEKGPKDLSSRMAMERTRSSSPYYPAWLADSEKVMKKAVEALSERNLDDLGPLIRNSYMRMFATMFAADPPVIYWKPISLEVIRFCEAMRSEGLSVWETMDAGPQVKLFCLDKDLQLITNRLVDRFEDINIRICRPGTAPRTTFSVSGINQI